MFSPLKRKWENIKKVTPGKRFQERYYRRRRKRQHRSQLRKLLNMIIGLLIIAVGIIFLFIPGSGWVIIFIGAMSISGESLTVARYLDWAEVELRECIEKLRI